MTETAAAAGTGVLFSPIAVILLFLVLMIIALAVYLIYSAIYRRRVNRALREDAPVGPTPEPRKVGTLIMGLMIAACVLGFLVWANHLQNRLAELEANLTNNINSMASRIEANNQEFLDELKKANSIFTEFDYEITQSDLSGRSATVSFRAMPREASTDARVVLRLHEEAIELERGASGVYTAILTRDPFQLPADQTAILSLIQDGTEQNQTVDIGLADRWRYENLPHVNAQVEYNAWTDESTRSIEGRVTIDVENLSRLRSLVFFVYQGETLVKEEDLYAAYLTDCQGDFVWLETSYNGDLPAGEELSFRLRYTDVNGLRCETLIFRDTPDEDFHYHVEDSSQHVKIYSADGELLTEYDYDPYWY